MVADGHVIVLGAVCVRFLRASCAGVLSVKVKSRVILIQLLLYKKGSRIQCYLDPCYSSRLDFRPLCFGAALEASVD